MKGNSANKSLRQLKKIRITRDMLTCSPKDLLVACGLYLASVAICLLLRQWDSHNNDSYVAMIFLLDVFLTAFLTEGFLLGVIFAVLAVMSVDFIFTAPYWAVSFTLAGFPLTFLVTMTISVLTSLITSRAKRVDAVRRDAEKERAYANLLRAVSHDIRTPLTGIVGATEVLLEQEETLSREQRRELLQHTGEEAQWLIHMVENMLSITRLGAKNARLTKNQEPLEEVIESAVMKFGRRHPHLPVEVTLPDELLMVPMDPVLIEQVLTNLLENAANHGKTAEKILITLEQDGDMACLTVSDDGAGIPKPQLENLFESQTYRTEQGDGKRNMGIGLSTCQTIVTAHNGKIQAENRKEGGAKFSVWLPMEEESNENS